MDSKPSDEVLAPAYTLKRLWWTRNLSVLLGVFGAVMVSYGIWLDVQIPGFRDATCVLIIGVVLTLMAGALELYRDSLRERYAFAHTLV